jgi:glycosyltransferase involved in cell wall biosynthesis
MVGMVGANKGNPSRKSFVAVLEAFAELRRRHENALLYLHTDLTGELSAGVPLPEVMGALDLPEESIRFADQYRIRFDPISPQLMALLYSAMDVLANPSTGGGFEIPMLEAQSCGVPVVTTDWTAMRETCGAGWRVGGQRTWTLQNSWQVLPEPKQILKALEQCYKMPAQKRQQLSEQARAFAQRFDADRVFEEHLFPAYYGGA